MSAGKLLLQGQINMLWPLADAKDLYRTCYQRGIQAGIRRGSWEDPVFLEGILFYAFLGNSTSGQGDPARELTPCIILRRT